MHRQRLRNLPFSYRCIRCLPALKTTAFSAPQCILLHRGKTIALPAALLLRSVVCVVVALDDH
jgi:hypothetical protein